MDALQIQSKFSRHGPCEKCGSRDNVAWYSNGTGFCFGCGAFYTNYEEASRSRAEVLRHLASDRSDRRSEDGQGAEVDVERRNGALRSPPDDITTLYSPEIVKWLGHYQLTPGDVLRHNVTWSPSRQQLYFQFFGESRRDPILWQARNFKQGTEHKNRFYTEGQPNEVVAMYYPLEQKNASTAVVVEDCVSAIKIANAGYSGVPCFGSGMSDTKLRRLAQMFKFIVFWLDHDKFKEATTLSRKIGLMGIKTCMVYTEEDPKCFMTNVIRDTIDGKVEHLGG